MQPREVLRIQAVAAPLQGLRQPLPGRDRILLVESKNGDEGFPERVRIGRAEYALGPGIGGQAGHTPGDLARHGGRTKRRQHLVARLG